MGFGYTPAQNQYQAPTAPLNNNGGGTYLGTDTGVGPGNAPSTSPATPNQAQSNQFLPSVFSSPFLQGINAGTQVSNWSSQALPAASAFQQSLYSPGVTPMEQSYLNSAATLSSNQLAQTQANIGGQFENSSQSSGLAPALLQAANQSSAQLDQLAGQMGTQRQQTAAASLPSTYQEPLAGSTAAQTASGNLYNSAQAAMYGDSSFPIAAIGTNTFTSPTVVSQPASQSSKGK